MGPISLGLHLLLALEDVLLGAPPKLEDLCVPSLLPPPLCVLFQTHPQLKFALKVSNFHSFQNNRIVLLGPKG